MNIWTLKRGPNTPPAFYKDEGRPTMYVDGPIVSADTVVTSKDEIDKALQKHAKIVSGVIPLFIRDAIDEVFGQS